MNRPLPILLLAAAASACAPGGEAPADLIVTGGKIVTMDDDTPFVEALAARAGKVVAIGDAATIEALRGTHTTVVELDGRTAVPGFTDAHAHFLGLGRARTNVDLRGLPSWEAVVARVAEEARGRPAGEWILGWGWHQDKWNEPPEPAVEGYPVHDALSAAVPDHPVLLKHHAGTHGGLVNAKAMELAGIDASTPDPPGGAILRDAGGNPTGVLREDAYDLALAAYERALQALGDVERERIARREAELANEECLRLGVTTVHDAGATFEEVDLFRTLYEEGRLDVRLYVMLKESDEALAEKMDAYRTVGDAGGRLTVRAIKRYADGALGTHGAWMLEPYEDLDTTGVPANSIESLEATARLARDHDYQLCVHAIGDRANREMLDLYERMTEGRDDPRWRIEHVQHLDADDVGRFAELGVIASMQSVHCTSDAPFVPKRLGDERAEEGAYVWRKLLDSGAVVANGTDAPIEEIDPLANFYSAVTRRPAGRDPFYPEQAMTRMEALAAATTAPAFAAFEETLKGRLTPGMVADLVVLSQDILTVDERRLLETRVEATIVGGHVLYRAAD